MTIETQGTKYELVEVPGEKISEIKCVNIALSRFQKIIQAGIKRIAVWAVEALNILRLQHLVEGPGGAAFGIGDDAAAIMRPRLDDRLLHCACDALGAIVLFGR